MQISFTQGGVREGARLPCYRLLVLAPFNPVAREAAPVAVGAMDFNAALKALAPRVTLPVDNLLSDAGNTWWLELSPSDLADFSPAGLVRAIPELAWIDGLRASVAAVAAGQAPLADLAARLADYEGVSGLAPMIAQCQRVLASPPAAAPAPAATPAPPLPSTVAASTPADDDPFARLLDLVDLPESAAAPAASPGRSAMSAAIATVARSARPRPVPALNAALAGIEDLLARQRAAILAQPQWVALESAWRGMRDLLASLDDSGRVEVLICSTNADDLLVDLDRCLAATAADARPLDLALIDLAFAATGVDRERLAGVAERAGAAALPVLVTLAPDFLGDTDGDALARLDHPARRLEAPEYIKWHALRAQGDCAWVAACFNDYLLREPGPGVPALWGGAGWLVARRILATVRRSGWPAPITGPRAGRIEDLRLLPGANGVSRPLRDALGNTQCEDLATVGILALSGPGPADTAWIVSAPSLLALPALADAAATAARREDASLGLQLVRARLLGCVRAIEARATETGADAAAAIERLLTDWIDETGDGAAVQVTPLGARRLALVARFGEQVAAGLVVELELQLD